MGRVEGSPPEGPSPSKMLKGSEDHPSALQAPPQPPLLPVPPIFWRQQSPVAWLKQSSLPPVLPHGLSPHGGPSRRGFGPRMPTLFQPHTGLLRCQPVPTASHRHTQASPRRELLSSCMLGNGWVAARAGEATEPVSLEISPFPPSAEGAEHSHAVGPIPSCAPVPRSRVPEELTHSGCGG